MEFIDERIIDYCLAHSGEESLLLQRMTRETHLEVLHPRMLSGHLQGRYLSMISKLMQPKVILELGTFTGYSAICLAEGLAEDGKLITIDKNVELEARARAYFSESGYDDKIDFRVGDALELIDAIDEPLDLIFIDADKANYLNYFKKLETKLRKGGLIIADNVLWSGKIVEPVGPKDRDTPVLLEFNKYVNESEQFENLLLPIRDGLMMVRKK